MSTRFAWRMALHHVTTRIGTTEFFRCDAVLVRNSFLTVQMDSDPVCGDVQHITA